ncbi:MAG: pyridoxamine 5'-phosphate oxidase family protein [Isosphaeraceae bacterium]|nr:pyridoxamine 5'-phosphate oxidase family protein [Isosphaeraceae bacterium]
MVIHEMSQEECLRLLAGARLARLACAYENQPYIVPVYLAYDVQPVDKPCLYGFTTPGQKVQWMRANPLVCIEVDDVTAHDQWVSVIAFGRYEELPDIPENNGQRLLAHQVFQVGRYEGPDAARRDDQQRLAHQILQSQAIWWEPACTAHAARTHREPAEPFTPVYYRVCLDRVTGHRATPDPGMANQPTAPIRKEGWLRRALGFGRPPLPL